MSNVYSLVFDEVITYLSSTSDPDWTMIRANGSKAYLFWVNMDDNSGSGFQYYYSSGSYGSAGSLNLYVVEGSDAFVARPQNIGAQVRSSARTFPTGWCLVCHQYNRDTLKWEIAIVSEGSTVTRNISSDTLTNNQTLSAPNIGRRIDGSAERYWGGKMGSIAVTPYDTYLDDSTLEALATSFLDYDPTTAFAPVLNFPFNEGIGSTVTDTVKGLVLTGSGFAGDSSQWVLEGLTGGGIIDVSATLSLTNLTTISIKGQKLSSTSLSNAALSTTNINSSKQVNAKVSVNSVNTVNMKCFKQAYGSLQLNSIVVVTLNGQIVIADTRNAVLFLTNQTVVTIKAQKLARSQLALQANTSVSSYGQKVAVSSLTTTSLATITINGSKVSIDSRSAILSLSNTTIVTIKSLKQTTASVNLSNAANVTIVAQKSASAALHLQNYVTTKITKYSDSYIPVVRRLCIQGQLITLSIPANINNKLIIKGCF